MRVELPEKDDDLLLLLRKGNEGAFVTLYRRRQASIYRFVLHMSGSESLAEDVTQEVFLALIREEFGYDPAKGTLVGYLFGIARKLVLKALEKGRSDVPLDYETEDQPPQLCVQSDLFADIARKEGIEALRRAVLALPRRYREVVVLCDLEETDYADAAGVLNCPIGTVRSRLHRARALLLEKLQHEHQQRQVAGVWKPARVET
jgi:RNA polymerase sigma-70 factor (ECF subfamily)